MTNEADRKFMDSVPGFYVVNVATETAVSGPHNYESIARMAAEEQPGDLLQVVLVDEEKC